MIKWPDRARAAIRRLFEPLQEIDVYVEDANDEAFYRCLLNSATNGEVNVARVFSLGGKEAVIEAAIAHDQHSRRALFIVDGDLPWVKGESIPAIIGLHCHDAYCIENLILCEKALSLLLSQEIAVTEEEATVRLAYNNWIKAVESSLLELFSAFATVHSFDPTATTVAQGVGVMCVKSHTTKITALDTNKVHQAKEQALMTARNIADAATVSSLYSRTLLRLKGLPQPLHAVSGKDFLLPLIDFHLQSLGCRIRRKSLRIRLVSSGDFTRFSPLANALKQAAIGYV